MKKKGKHNKIAKPLQLTTRKKKCIDQQKKCTTEKNVMIKKIKYKKLYDGD